VQPQFCYQLQYLDYCRNGELRLAEWEGPALAWDPTSDLLPGGPVGAAAPGTAPMHQSQPEGQHASHAALAAVQRSRPQGPCQDPTTAEQQSLATSAAAAAAAAVDAAQRMADMLMQVSSCVQALVCKLQPASAVVSSCC
jgi:hypothetical protein